MRRFIAVVATLLVIAGGPAASTPGAGAEAAQMAFADWALMTSRHSADFYFVEAHRVADARGTTAHAVVGHGTCRVSRGKTWILMICTGRGRPTPVSLEQFWMDPALDSAHLDFRSQGYRHRVDWVGVGDPGLATGTQTQPSAVQGDAWFARQARASGRLFGRALSGRGDSFADLAYGAFAGVWPTLAGRSIEYRDDGTVVVSARYRFRR